MLGATPGTALNPSSILPPTSERPTKGPSNRCVRSRDFTSLPSDPRDRRQRPCVRRHRRRYRSGRRHRAGPRPPIRPPPLCAGVLFAYVEIRRDPAGRVERCRSVDLVGRKGMDTRLDVGRHGVEIVGWRERPAIRVAKEAVIAQMVVVSETGMLNTIRRPCVTSPKQAWICGSVFRLPGRATITPAAPRSMTVADRSRKAAKPGDETSTTAGRPSARAMMRRAISADSVWVSLGASPIMPRIVNPSAPASK